MILHPDELRRRLREAMDAASIDAAELARRVNRRPDYFRDFLNGRKSSVKLGELAKLDEVLGLEAGTFGFFSDTPTGIISEDKKRIYQPRSSKDDVFRATILSERKMFIYASRDVGSGILEIPTDDPVDIVYRPWFLKFDTGGFGFLVNGEAMSPAFESGSVAIVNPTLPPSKGRYVLLTSGNRDQPEFRAALRRLLAWDDDLWHVQQVKDGKEAKLSRVEWPEALRVVCRLDE